MAAETAMKLVNKEMKVQDITFDFCKLCVTFCKKDDVKSKAGQPEYYI
jgi:hypothetical protein